ERVRLQRARDLLGGERLLAVDQQHVVGAGGVAALLGLLEIELLADVDEHGHDLVVAVELFQPGDDAGRVEAAGVGEDGGLAHAAPSRRWATSSSRSVSAETPARGTTTIVLSPAIVASTWGWPEPSIASARGAANPRGVKTTTRWSLHSTPCAQRRKAASSSRRRSASTAPGCA